MRKWRIGTVSMGLSLITLGVFLFISQIKGSFLVEPFLIWWPIILIVLGIEITAYIILSKQENPILKYDFISIVFVVIIGTVGIGFTILTSTGIMKELQMAIHSEEETFSLPVLKERLPENIKKIVIDPGNHPVKIDSSNSNDIHVFGTYRTTLTHDHQLASHRQDSRDEGPIGKVEDYVLMEKVGGTLYVYLKEPKLKKGLFTATTQVETTIVVPEQLLLEMRSDSYRTMDLYPGALSNHWIIDHQGSLNVHISKNSDILLAVNSTNDLNDGSIQWDDIQTTTLDGEVLRYRGTLKFGEALHNLAIFNSQHLNVHVIDEL